MVRVTWGRRPGEPSGIGLHTRQRVDEFNRREEKENEGSTNKPGRLGKFLWRFQKKPPEQTPESRSKLPQDPQLPQVSIHPERGSLAQAHRFAFYVAAEF